MITYTTKAFVKIPRRVIIDKIRVRTSFSSELRKSCGCPKIAVLLLIIAT
jgi:hypothetical protein